MIRKFFIFGLVATGLLISACSSDDDGPATAPIEVNILNLQSLDGSVVYKAWLRANGEDISLGSFTDANFPKTFTTLASDVEAASEFFISIEESSSADTPSETRIVSATFSGASNTAQVSSASSIADFSSMSGSFALRTFTGEMETGDPNGIWFTNTLNGATTITPGLSLPTLSTGWSYEAWIVLDDNSGVSTTLPLGKFLSATESDTSDIFSAESNAAPEIPGEDFLDDTAGNLVNIDFPANLVGARVFVTLEPTSADDTSSPFFIELLSLESATANAINTMDANNFFITGSVER